MYRTCCIALLALSALAPLPTRAELPADDEWRFIINFPMIWAPDISGKITADGVRSEVEISFSDILDQLDFGFIGELWVHRGPWGVGWRSMYLGTETQQVTEATGIPGRPPIIGKHELTLSGALFTSDLILDYKFNEIFGLYTGVRLTGTQIDYRIKPLEPGLIEIDRKLEIADEKLYDWVVGVDLGYDFTEKWRGNLQMDTLINGDNSGNNFVNAFMSYSFNERHSLWFGYRYLSVVKKTRQDGGRLKTDFTQQGPTLGWTFTF